MKRTIFNINQLSSATIFAQAFEVYQREYLCKSESEIKEEQAKFEHCIQLVTA